MLLPSGAGGRILSIDFFFCISSKQFSDVVRVV